MGKKKKRIYRSPKCDSSGKRDQRLSCRVTRHELADIQKMAAMEQVSVADYVVNRCLGLEQRVPEHRKPKM